MAVKLPSNGRVLGLDIGDARIGLASAHVVAQIPAPLETVNNDESLNNILQQIVKQEDIMLLVVGVPRNLKGEETAQSAKIRSQAQEIANFLQKELVFVDESLSSKRADAYLKQHKNSKVAQDSIAACFILEEFLSLKGHESR